EFRPRFPKMFRSSRVCLSTVKLIFWRINADLTGTLPLRECICHPLCISIYRGLAPSSSHPDEHAHQAQKKRNSPLEAKSTKFPASFRSRNFPSDRRPPAHVDRNLFVAKPKEGGADQRIVGCAHAVTGHAKLGIAQPIGIACDQDLLGTTIDLPLQG